MDDLASDIAWEARLCGPQTFRDFASEFQIWNGRSVVQGADLGVVAVDASERKRETGEACAFLVMALVAEAGTGPGGLVVYCD